MQSAAAIGLLRPCAARPLLNPSPRGCGRPLLPPARGLRISAVALRADLAAARGRIGLVPASPEQEDRSGRGSRHVAAAVAAGKEEAGGEAGGGLAKTLQLGALFGLWYLFNIYFNIYNKQVLKVFPYPINITNVQFAAGTVIALVMWITGIVKRPKISGAQLAAILPLAIVHTMGNLFTNMSLGKVAVSFTHTIKAMEPFFSVLLSAIFLGELPTPWVVLSLVPIVGGVGLASLTEASFNWAGFWSAMASNVTFQSRNVLSKKLMVKKEESLDNINLFSIITVMSFFLLAPVTLLTEGVKVTPTVLQSAGLNLKQTYTRSLIAAFPRIPTGFIHDPRKGVPSYSFSGQLCQACGGYCDIRAVLQDPCFSHQLSRNWGRPCWRFPILAIEEAQAQGSLTAFSCHPEEL